MLFNSSLGLKLDPKTVAGEIARFMNDAPDRKYKVIIGTDSMPYYKNQADFVTAIVVHRVGNGGRYFWRRAELGNIHTLRERVYREALLSIEIAKDFILLMKAADSPAFDFEIHVDIGENGATKSMIQEIVGMIRANDFEVRTKPESYAATKVADKHT